MWFSVLCLIAVPLVSRGLHVRSDDQGQAVSYIVIALGLALASVLASWQLVAALLELRPALSDRSGRWVWAWTLVFCVAFLSLGLLNRTGQTIGAAVLVASGWVVALVGVVGLTASAVPKHTPGSAPRE